MSSQVYRKVFKMRFTRLSGVAFILAISWLTVAAPTRRSRLNTITRISVEEQKSKTIVRLHGSSKPDFSVFKLDRPPRLTLDLANCVLQNISDLISVNTWAVGQIATMQFRTDVSTIARVMINFRRRSHYQVNADGHEIVITIVPYKNRPHSQGSGSVQSKRIQELSSAHKMGQSELKKARDEVSRARQQALAAKSAAKEAQTIAKKRKQSLHRVETALKTSKRNASAYRGRAEQLQENMIQAQRDAELAKRRLRLAEKNAAKLNAELKHAHRQAIEERAKARREKAKALQEKKNAELALRKAQLAHEKERTTFARKQTSAEKAAVSALRNAEQARREAELARTHANIARKEANAQRAELKRTRQLVGQLRRDTAISKADAKRKHDIAVRSKARLNELLDRLAKNNLKLLKTRTEAERYRLALAQLKLGVKNRKQAVEQLQQQVEKARDALSHAKRADASKRKTALQSLQKELNQAKRRVTEAKNDRKRMVDMISEARVAQTRADRANQQAQAIARNLKEAAQKAESTRKKAVAARDDALKAKSKAEKAAAKASRALATERKRRLRAEEAYRKASQRADELSKALAVLSEDKQRNSSKSKVQVESLRRQLNKARKVQRQKQLQLHALARERDELKKKVSVSNQRIVALNNSVLESRAKNQRLQQKIKTLDAQVEQAKKSILVSNRALGEQRKQLLAARKQLAQERDSAKREKLQREIANRTKRLDAERTRRAQKLAEHRKLQKSLLASQRKKRVLSLQLRSARSKLDEAERRSRVTRKSLVDLERKVESRREALVDLEKRHSKRRGAYMALVQRNDEAQRKLVSARERVRRAEDRQSVAEEKLAKLREELSSLKSEKRRVQQSIEDLKKKQKATLLASAKPVVTTNNKSTAVKKKQRKSPVSIDDIRFIDEPDAAVIVIKYRGDIKHAVHHMHHLSWLEFKNAELPKRLRRTLDTTAFSGPVQTISSFTKEKPSGRIALVTVKTETELVGKLERTPTQLVWRFSKKQGQKQVVTERSETTQSYVSQRVAASVSRRPSSAKRRYSGRRIDLDFKDADIHNILRLLADVGNVNIITSDAVSGKVTIRMKNVPWDQALDVILRSKGLGQIREGNLIRIAPLSDLEKEREAELARQKQMMLLRPIETRLLPLSYAQASAILPKLQYMLSPRGKLTFDERTNTVIASDVASNLALMEKMIRNLDTQTPQVVIEARIVEARANYNKQIGVQWGGGFTASAATGNSTGLVFPNQIGVGGGTSDQNTPTEGVLLGQAANPNFAVNMPATTGLGSGGALGLTLGSVSGALNINLRLSAAESKGDIRIISAPKITTLDNVEAKIEQGVTIPFSQVSAQGVQTTFRDAKLSLTVKPHVTADGSVIMKIKVERNEPDFVNTGPRGDPTILKKEATTEMLVSDGDTAVIGGIYTTRDGRAWTKVPWFADIPVIGWLFKSKRDSSDREEVLVFITPRIINRAQSIGSGS